MTPVLWSFLILSISSLMFIHVSTEMYYNQECLQRIKIFKEEWDAKKKLYKQREEMEIKQTIMQDVDKNNTYKSQFDSLHDNIEDAKEKTKENMLNKSKEIKELNECNKKLDIQIAKIKPFNDCIDNNDKTITSLKKRIKEIKDDTIRLVNDVEPTKIKIIELDNQVKQVIYNIKETNNMINKLKRQL